MSVLSTPAQETAASTEARGRFFGSKWEYRRILWGAMPALIVTLGLHRFTVTTNIRRYLWSRTAFAGEQLDYTGDALELLLGFLVLMVVLAPVVVAIAIYGWTVGEIIPFASFAPLILLVLLAILALYQARRYRLNHTAFRGLRFRQTGSAWVYFLHILFWFVVVTVTLGLAYPWARADLERYKMRHTYYGDLQGSFVGRGWVLFKRGFVPWLLSLLLSLVPPILLASQLDSDDNDEAIAFVLISLIWMLIVGLVFYPVFRAIVVRWRVAGMRFGGLSCESNFSTWRFAKPYLKFYGWMVLLAVAVALLNLAVQSWVVPRLPLGQSLAVEIGGVVGLVVAYFSIATIIAFAFQGTVRFETWRLIVDSLVLRGVDQLDRAKAPATSAARRKGQVAAALNLGGF